MRIALSVCLLLLVSLSAHAKDESQKRVDRIFTAGAAWMRHSGQLLLKVIEAVDPADCSSGTRAMARFSEGSEQDKKLLAALKAASATATKEEQAQVQQRLVKELGPELNALTEKTNAALAKLKKFQGTCPAEAKVLHEAMQAHTGQMP
jgi:nucleotide-binding universal stress UspA family protein